ncbi:MAG: ribonuclease E/G, partial [Brevundimonas sp.]|nr:ribonuclease E/G [Brevundimonas sp.]
AAEAARQLRLRDLAGLIVIDFIDMDEGKNNRAVEKVLKDALAKDRARIQMGRISGFGLMEISRQRRRLGVIEGATEVCPHCQGAGRVRSAESAALMTLRAVDIEAGKNGAGSINLRLCTAVALYILNHKRDYLQRMLAQRGLNVVILIDDSLGQGEHAVERTETNEDFVPLERPEAFVDLDDDFDDSAYADEDDGDDEFIAGDDDSDLDAEDTDDDQPRERTERAEGEGGRGRGRRRRGGRRDSADASTDEAAVAAPAAGEDDDDSESGRRRRRGRRGGRRVREEGGERDGFNWVRGRTPSLEDPYVWFDPINPERTESTAGSAVAAPSAADVDEVIGERPEGEIGGERGPRSRRRRGRGRGRDRGGEQGLTHEVKVETRATNEGMPPDGSPDTPMAVVVDDAADAAPVTIAEEPKRRRVRRKVSGSATAESAAEPTSKVEPNEIESMVEPAILDVTPAEAAAEVEPVTEPKVAAVVEPTPAPQPEVDVAALIAEDPNQIVAPPEKPKRGWWRR